MNKYCNHGWRLVEKTKDDDDGNVGGVTFIGSGMKIW